MKWECENWTYSFQSIVWQRRTTVSQNSSDSSVTNRKKKQPHSQLLKLFILPLPSCPDTCLQLLATSAPKKKTLTLSVQFSPTRQDKGQISHSRGKESDQMPEVCPEGRGEVLKFRFDRRISFLATHKWVPADDLWRQGHISDLNSKVVTYV